jgi:chromosome segregation ATPase
VTRDDEFSHIPELGPARDTLDQPVIPASLRRAPETVAPASAAPDKTSASGSGLMPWLLLLLMLIMGAGGYWGMEQTNLLQKQLLESNRRLASLEGLIDATDESASRSGAALQAQIKASFVEGEKRLKHVDSELAKLWTVSYQRNKPKIAEMDQTLASLDMRSVELKAQSAALAVQLKQAQDGLGRATTDLQHSDLQQQALQAKLSGLETALQAGLTDLSGRLQLRDQTNQELDSMQDTQLQQVERRIKTLEQDPQVLEALTQMVKDHQRAIAAINSFRQQANSEFQRIGHQIELLQVKTR